jgi:hypothetical protein
MNSHIRSSEVVTRSPKRKPMPRQMASRSLVRKRLTHRQRVFARGGKGNNEEDAVPMIVAIETLFARLLIPA